MKIHEYQAKEVLSRFGIPVPRGRVASTTQEVVEAAKELGGDSWVVKAQIHAGGRGKGGGVKVARGLDELQAVSSRILGMQLVTPQTGPEGRRVKQVLVAEACKIEREIYAGIVLDRGLSLPVLMASAEGGVEIEEVAARSPDKILRESFSPVEGLHAYQGRLLAVKLGLLGPLLAPAASLFVKLSKAFLETDASLAEINPLVLVSAGEGKDARVLALDAKFSFDDNALFRHPELKEYRDLDEEDPQEVRASQFDLSYIKMDGSIGCMVNGAGLAMATLDIIQHHGGKPANFLDVGGGATREKVTEAFRIILDDANVKAILVNIFGGIMKCDVIAEGIIAAVKTTSLKVPLVVRLEGTNVEKGKELIAGSGLNILLAEGLADAARKVVRASGGGRA
ncbi:MAG TPA: ADP-forming succinate--CoA ligase subunit beta [Planctomycetota bacterium]|nr:ADP-forming succinate--CoA ligase subunit beta [Planctomycetota bacterium]